MNIEEWRKKTEGWMNGEFSEDCDVSGTFENMPNI